VFVDISATGHTLAEWMSRLADEGLIVTTVGGRVRMLTHVDVDERDIDTALAAWRRVAAELAAPVHR